MDLGLHVQDFPCSPSLRADLSKERAGGNMKHLDAGRASLLCSHTLTFPPGATSTTHFHSMITKEKLMIITTLAQDACFF